MKKQLLFLTFLSLTVSGINAQIIQSSCTTTDSIIKSYRKDAARMAVRQVHKINSTYKDSIKIQQTLKDRYYRALIAVYNATALPVRDTLVNLYKIHTDLDPELNVLEVKATSTVNWMQQLQVNSPPTSNQTVLDLMNKYSMSTSYYQSTLFDLVVFRSDSNLNISALRQAFLGVQGVQSAAPGFSFNDVKNITDSVNSAFIGLSYSIGWGSCEDTCNFRKYWNVKVYNDCSVEYMGSTGAPLFVGLNKLAFEQQISIFPNPFSQVLTIENSDNLFDGNLSVYNLMGEEILVDKIIGQKVQIDLSIIPAGIYILKLQDGNNQITRKIIKD